MHMKSIRHLAPYALSLGLLAAAGAAVTACDSVSNPQTEALYGNVHNDCGPADGAVVSFQIDTAVYDGCGTGHTGEFRTRLDEVSHVDSLKPGHVVADTQVYCGFVNCEGRQTVFRIEILSVDSGSVTADIRIESNATGTQVIRAGKAVLAKCRTRPMCG